MLALLAIPFFLSAQLPSGYTAHYTLDNNAVEAGGNTSYNGTLTSVTGTTNRFGTSNTAIQLTSGTSYGTIPVVVKDNFTVGFWIKTNMTASSSSQWYGGNSLIDAEVCGVTNDWGIALINGGKIAFGTGNPDKTIISPSSYNDNAWHFITATRDKSGTGTMILYVDGSQVVSLTSVNTGTLSAPSFIGLGRNNCTGADYTGSLDDLIFYPSVLSSAQVTNLYNYMNTVVLAVNWVSFTGKVSGSNIDLQWKVPDSKQIDHFEIERSTDGETFSLISTLPKSNNSADGNVSFAFADGKPASGINYYRIKEVDVDGTYSYSNIIHLSFQNSFSGIRLLSNPAINNMLVIENPNQQMIQAINIIDMAGRILERKNFQSQNTSLQINLNNLTPGYYFIQVSTIAKTVSIPFIK